MYYTSHIPSKYYKYSQDRHDALKQPIACSWWNLKFIHWINNQQFIMITWNCVMMKKLSQNLYVHGYLDAKIYVRQWKSLASEDGSHLPLSSFSKQIYSAIVSKQFDAYRENVIFIISFLCIIRTIFHTSGFPNDFHWKNTLHFILSWNP
jgi:hypothetical protein